MARTQAPNFDDRRGAIVAVAASLFARRGFDGTSVADVAKQCGLSKALIYHYFESKEDMLYETMIDHVRTLDETARAVTSEPGDPEQKLRDLTRRFLEVYVDAADRHKVLLNELDKLPKARRSEIVAVQRGLIEIVRDLLSQLEPSLKRRGGRSFAAAMLYFGMINWTHTWFDASGSVSTATLADMAVDMVLGGLTRMA